jgi:hypothetical protein
MTSASFRPAAVAGLVGLGVALVVVISFELIFAVQAIVFLLALPIGLLIGWYANTRDRTARELAVVASGGAARSSATRIGWPRAIANGFIAGVITAVALALLYVLLRLLFLYLDTGFRADGAAYACTSGPDCGYQRALDEPRVREALAEAGVHDAAAYTAFFLEGQVLGAASLLVLVIGGSVVGAAASRAASSGPAPSTIVAEGPR